MSLSYNGNGGSKLTNITVPLNQTAEDKQVTVDLPANGGQPVIEPQTAVTTPPKAVEMTVAPVTQKEVIVPNSVPDTKAPVPVKESKVIHHGQERFPGDEEKTS